MRITAVAVRQQLMKLQAESLVEHRDARLTVGRPKRHWRLTEAAQSRFPDAHAGMTLEILAAARTVFGEEGVDRLIAARETASKAAYAQRLGPARGLKQKVERLAAARAEEGYMAECRSDSDGTLWLIENHCPVCAAARECQGFCRSELGDLPVPPPHRHGGAHRPYPRRRPPLRLPDCPERQRRDRR